MRPKPWLGHLEKTFKHPNNLTTTIKRLQGAMLRHAALSLEDSRPAPQQDDTLIGDLWGTNGLPGIRCIFYLAIVNHSVLYTVTMANAFQK